MCEHMGCPWCGGHDIKVKPLWGGKYRFVACETCRAAGPVAKTDEEALRLWDERATPGEFVPEGMDPMPGVPEVEVVDGEGRVLDVGWYVCHQTVTGDSFGGGVGPEHIQHVVVSDEASDWCMPRGMQARVIQPPLRIRARRGARHGG